MDNNRLWALFWFSFFAAIVAVVGVIASVNIVIASVNIKETEADAQVMRAAVAAGVDPVRAKCAIMLGRRADPSRLADLAFCTGVLPAK